MLHLRQLQCALVLAEYGSFQLAASKLGITPSGLTQSIQRLESYYGNALFTRSRSGVSLTPMGEIVIEGARSITQRAAAVEREIGLRNNPETGQLHIGVDPTLGNTVLAPALVYLMNIHPQLHYTVFSGSRQVLGDQLGNKEIDFFISYPTVEGSDKDLESITMSIPAPIVVGRPGHPLAALKDPKIQLYFDYPRLGAGLPEWYAQWAGQQLSRDGIDVNPATGYLLYADDLGLMKSVVQRTDALMGLFRGDVELELDAGLLVELNPEDWPEQVSIELVTSTAHPLALTAEKFVEAIVDGISQGT